MPCPRCKTELVSKTYENVQIDSCNRCNGTWLAASNLRPILDAHDMNFAPALIDKTLKEAHTGIPKAEVETLLSCPKCSRAMNALNYDYSSGVIVNVCPNGDGIWFDKDELAEVQIFMEHWNAEESKNKAKWDGLAKQAELDEYSELDKEDAEIQKDLGPISRTLDAVFYQFKKWGREK